MSLDDFKDPLENDINHAQDRFLKNILLRGSELLLITSLTAALTYGCARDIKNGYSFRNVNETVNKNYNVNS